MTTIAWDGKTLAADTLSTCSGIRSAYHAKIWREGRLLIGGAGSRTVTLQFRDWVRTGMKGACPLTKDIGNVFVVTPDGTGVMWCDDGPFHMDNEPWALGSGEQFALGAMAAGKTAEEAVAIAALYDTCTGGDVTALKIAV